eukprot:7503159-Pyramimonas_sp.AAC.1
MPPTGGWSTPCSRVSDVGLGRPTRSNEDQSPTLPPPTPAKSNLDPHEQRAEPVPPTLPPPNPSDPPGGITHRL